MILKTAKRKAANQMAEPQVGKWEDNLNAALNFIGPHNLVAYCSPRIIFLATLFFCFVFHKWKNNLKLLHQLT